MSSFTGGSSSMSGYGGMRPNTGLAGRGKPTGGNLRGGQSGDIVPKGYEVGQLQQFTPDQMKLFQQMISYLGPEGFLAKLAGGDESQFEEMEAPAHRMFQGQLGQLASRFSGASGGGTGGRHGSGFQNAATAASSNFAQDLAANRQNLSRQALNDLMGFSNQLLQQRPTQRDLFEKPQKDNSSSGWGGLIGAGLGGLAGYLSPVPGGALKGAKIGYGVGSGF